MKRRCLLSLAAALLPALLLPSAAPAAVWHSYNATIRTDAEAVGLIRGDIAGLFGMNAELEFYGSNAPFLPTPVRANDLRHVDANGNQTTVVASTGVFRPNNNAPSWSDGLTTPLTTGGQGAHGGLDGGPWWVIPGTISGANNQLYVGKSGVGRGMDLNETGPLPGGPGTFGVSDLEIHPPTNDNLSVISFIAPRDGQYIVNDLAIRRIANSASQQGAQSVKMWVESDGVLTEIVDSLTTAQFSQTGQSWVINPNAFTLDLLQGDRILFGVHNGVFTVDPAHNWGFDNTELAFSIMLVPEPASVAVWGMLLVGCLLMRRRKRLRRLEAGV